MKSLFSNRYGFLFGAGALIVFVGLFVIPTLVSTKYLRGSDATTTPRLGIVSTENLPASSHVATPSAVKGIYISGCAIGTPSFGNSLIKLVDETDLNTVIIDIKDFSGTISFGTDDLRFKDASLVSCGVKDMKTLIEELHAKNIYVIGRITVFQDPYYAKLHPNEAVQSKSRPGEPWRDHKGLQFIDVSSKPFWNYIVDLSRLSYSQGYDELNYDYVRYPSDGDMKDAVYQNGNKAEALEIFFKYLHEQVDPIGVVMSADVFGLAASNSDDLGIGQVLERALPYFDYIMPMVYPSHYPKGFNGLSNPNLYPYEVVNYAMTKAVARTVAVTTFTPALSEMPIASTSPQQYSKTAYDKNKIRPWLQDFNYGKTYTPADITAQIKATTDAGLTSYIFWDAGNKYANVRTVFAK